MKRSNIIIGIMVLMAIGCKNTPKFEGFDTSAWKSDKMGCLGNRHKLEDNFIKIKEDLIGLSQTQVFELLGNPDVQKLHGHNQKFFVYFLEGGKCKTQSNKKARIVNMRFSAIGIVTEVMLEHGTLDVERGF